MIELGRTTTTSLMLDALRDPENQTVWSEFDARFRPIIECFAVHLGLNGDDAAEIAQITLAQFARDYRAERYQRGRGRLSAWLIGIARHRVIDFQRARGRKREVRGVSAIADLQDEHELTRIWETERRRCILLRALDELRFRSRTSETTLRAFELIALRGLSAQEVSRECDVPVSEVYRIKNRVTSRLRQIVEELTQSYTEGD